MKNWHLLIHIDHFTKEELIELLTLVFEKIKNGSSSGTEYDETYLPYSYWNLCETETKCNHITNHST